MKALKEDLPKDYNRGPSDPYNQVKKYKNNTNPPKTKTKAKNLHSIQIESAIRILSSTTDLNVGHIKGVWPMKLLKTL